jgi:hypothetical protein
MSIPIAARLCPVPLPPRLPGSIPWRVLPLQVVFALGLLVAPGAAALITPEEGEAQLLDLLNHQDPERLKPDALLRALADGQARVNARRRDVGERDDQGRGFRDRCLWAGLAGEAVTAEEFYFRTLHAYGGALVFDPMVKEALAKRYAYVGIRCVAGEDGMYYWCITFCRVTGREVLASSAGPPPRRGSGSIGTHQDRGRTPSRTQRDSSLSHQSQSRSWWRSALAGVPCQELG